MPTPTPFMLHPELSAAFWSLYWQMIAAGQLTSRGWKIRHERRVLEGGLEEHTFSPVAPWEVLR